jgi:hypothetical protein
MGDVIMRFRSVVRGALWLMVAAALGSWLAQPMWGGLLRGVGGVVAEHGTLFTQDTDPMNKAGDTIYDFELQALVKEHIGTTAGTDYQNMVFAFTQCYAGRFLDEFKDMGNTAVLCATDENNPSVYTGYHAALADNLKPGMTTDSIHAAAEANAKVNSDGKGDYPVKGGTNQTVGGTSSTHVLVWAGQPNEHDQADIDKIHANFSGHPNTTVTVLAGNGTGNNADGPATRAELIQALKDIGAMMNANEQFVFVATDHGNADQIEVKATDISAGPQSETLDAPTLADMLNDPNNMPQLSFFSQQQITASMIPTVSFNSQPFPWNAFGEFMLDYNDNGFSPGGAEPDLFKYSLILPEPLVLASGNTVDFFFLGPGTLALEGIALESGGIEKLQFSGVPEPSSLWAWMGVWLVVVSTVGGRQWRRARLANRARRPRLQ